MEKTKDFLVILTGGLPPMQSCGDGHRSAALNLNSGYFEYSDAIFMRWRLAKSAQEPHNEEISRRKFGPPMANMPTMAALIMSNFSLILATRFLIDMYTCKKARCKLC